MVNLLFCDDSEAFTQPGTVQQIYDLELWARD